MCRMWIKHRHRHRHRHRQENNRYIKSIAKSADSGLCSELFVFMHQCFMNCKGVPGMRLEIWGTEGTLRHKSSPGCKLNHVWTCVMIIWTVPFLWNVFDFLFLWFFKPDDGAAPSGRISNTSHCCTAKAWLTLSETKSKKQTKSDEEEIMTRSHVGYIFKPIGNKG